MARGAGIGASASRFFIERRVVGDITHVEIGGVIDEDADLSALEGLEGRVELNLRAVRRFNSIGTRFWVDAMRALSQRSSLVFVECSSSVIQQLDMIRGFLGHGRVRSFYAPMRCEPCDREEDRLFTTDECRDRDGLPPVRCEGCGGQLELDELEDSYLLFLREPTVVFP